MKANAIGVLMKNSSNAIREVFVHLRVSDSKRAIQFYVEAFGAVEKFRLTEPSGRVGVVSKNPADSCCRLSARDQGRQC